MPGQTGRHDAIKHIHSSLDTFDNVSGFADAKQMAGLVFRQERLDVLESSVHRRFAESAADTNAEKRLLTDEFG